VPRDLLCCRPLQVSTGDYLSLNACTANVCPTRGRLWVICVAAPSSASGPKLPQADERYRRPPGAPLQFGIRKLAAAPTFFSPKCEFPHSAQTPSSDNLIVASQMALSTIASNGGEAKLLRLPAGMCGRANLAHGDASHVYCPTRVQPSLSLAEGNRQRPDGLGDAGGCAR
jgi:hypothetical protein